MACLRCFQVLCDGSAVVSDERSPNRAPRYVGDDGDFGEYYRILITAELPEDHKPASPGSGVRAFEDLHRNRNYDPAAHPANGLSPLCLPTHGRRVFSAVLTLHYLTNIARF
jgi:hypothetical protein